MEVLPPHPGFDALVSARVEELGIRGAAIAVYERGVTELPYTKGYGRVSSGGSSEPVTPDTAFLLASVSKPFAAAAVAVLVDREIISSLDEDICGFVPSNWKAAAAGGVCKNPFFGDTPVTWRSILTHRSSMKRDLPEATDEAGDPVYATYGWYDGAGESVCPLANTKSFYGALLGSPDAITSVGAGIVSDWNKLAEDSMGGMWREDSPPGAESGPKSPKTQSFGRTPLIYFQEW